MSEHRVNIGIIGTGVGVQMHLPGFLHTGKANITAIAGTNEERTQGYANRFEIPEVYTDYRRLCESPEVDLVCIGTPNTFHYEHVLCALQQGKHVLAEKPLATNLEQIRDLCAAAKGSAKLSLVDYELRFNPYLRKVRDLIRTGQIGRPYFIRIHQQIADFSNPDAPWSWSCDASMGGGVRLAMGSHLVDLLWFWVGCRKIHHLRGALDTVTDKRRSKSGEPIDVTACAFFSAAIAMEGRLDVQLSTTWAALGEERFDFSVYGTEGELHFDAASKLSGAFLSHRGTVKSISVSGVIPEEEENRTTIFKGSFVYFARQIVEAVLTQSCEPVVDAATFEDAIPVQEVLEAIRTSALEGNKVTMNDGYEPGARY